MTSAKPEHCGMRGADAEARTRRLRVCHLTKFYPPARGGIETHTRTLARAQADLGSEVSVVCVNHRDASERDVTWDSLARTQTVEEWDGPVRVTRLGKWGNLARLDLCPGLFRLAPRLQDTADVLHLHAPNPTMTLTLAALPRRLPLVVTHHSDVVRQRVLGRFFRPVEHLVYSGAAAVVSDSPSYAEGSTLLQCYAEKTTVLPPGLFLNPYLEAGAAERAHATRLRGALGQPLWLVVGRLVYYKGLHNALRALTSLPGRLLVIGDGPAEGELRRLATELQITERVVWRGPVGPEELVGAYHAATALWFPSNARSESFGMVQVEAMASGCPVINAAIPASGVPWVSRHEESGLTIPVDDPAALAAASRRLLDEPDLRKRLGQAGRERARREFDCAIMAERSLELYRSILKGAVRQCLPLRPDVQHG
jgi:rhamnosyl/mannosyltransferase